LLIFFAQHITIIIVICYDDIITITMIYCEVIILHFLKITNACCMWLFLQLFDTYSLDHMKTFKTDRPVNSAAISPLKPHVR